MLKMILTLKGALVLLIASVGLLLESFEELAEYLHDEELQGVIHNPVIIGLKLLLGAAVCRLSLAPAASGVDEVFCRFEDQVFRSEFPLRNETLGVRDETQTG